MRLDFYLLETGGPEAALAPLAARVLAGGGRLLVVADAERQRQALSQALWGWRPESFLANGLAGGPDEAGQPILIAPTPDPANGARCVALADGQWRDLPEGAFDRAFLIFGEEHRAPAREIWRMAKAREDWECHLHRQEGGRWVQAG